MVIGFHAIGATAGIAVTSAVNLLAQVASEAQPVVQITSAGATASSVAALIWVVKKVADGTFVAKTNTETEHQLVEANKVLIEMVRDAQKREDRFYELVALGKIPRGEGDLR
jgi:hypothetical protein